MKRVALALLVGVAACGSHHHRSRGLDRAAAIRIIGAADRSQHDHMIDNSRKPIDTLVFAGVGPGMHVAELGAGEGYTSELLARAIEPGGTLIAQDSPTWDGPWLQGAWKERGARPAMAHTTHVVLPWESPLPAGTHDLDEVVFVCAYHDVVAEKGDPDKLLASVFAALAPGGALVVIDNSARDGSGTGDAGRLHRIDEQVVRAAATRAGFRLASTADFLRNPADARDWNADPGAKDPRARTQDRFALRFVKP